MKKTLFAFIFLLMLTELFAQPKYFNSTQIGLLMGNRQISTPIPVSPYYTMPSPVSSYYDPYSYYFYTNSETQFSPSVTMTNGIKFNDHWAAGVGIGYEIWDRNLFPLFVDVRYTVWGNRVSPFFALKSGYAFSSFKKKKSGLDKHGGFLMQPEMGVCVPLSQSTGLLFTVAYRYQQTKSTERYTYGAYYDSWVTKDRFNRLEFGVAFVFN